MLCVFPDWAGLPIPAEGLTTQVYPGLEGLREYVPNCIYQAVFCWMEIDSLEVLELINCN